MVRIRRFTWVVALLLFVAGLVARVFVSLKDPGHGVFGAVLLGLGYAFITALLVLVLGALVAVPVAASSVGFGQRMWLRLPFVILGVVLVMLVAAYLPEMWERGQGMRSFRDRPYDEEKTASPTDCASVHEGVFWNEGIHIERKGGRQYQRDKLIGREEEMAVSWSSPCEYVLHVSEDFDMFVKITRVDSAGYDCVVYLSKENDNGYSIRLERGH